MYDLSEFVDPKGFKSYEALKERRDLVFGLSTNSQGETVQDSSPVDEFESAPRNVFANAKPVTAPTPSVPVTPVVQQAQSAPAQAKQAEPDPWDSDFDFDKLMSDS